jgi:hypothetical protein
MQLMHRCGIEQKTLVEVIKSQCFRGIRPENVTDAQLAAFISVANSIPNINPLLPGFLYAYIDDRTQSVVPMLGPESIFSMLYNNDDLVSPGEGKPAYFTEHAMEGDEPICTAFINHRTKGTLRKKIYVREWIVEKNPNWQKRPKHMAELRALKQCARQVIHGMPEDEDEKMLREMQNVTPGAAARADLPPAETKGIANVKETVKRNKRAEPPPVDAEVVTESKAQHPPVDQTPANVLPPQQPPAESKAPDPAENTTVIEGDFTLEEEKKPEPPTPKKEPRTTLNEGETASFSSLKILDVKAVSGKDNKPGMVVAQVEGDFIGQIYHRGGLDAAGRPIPFYSVGKSISVTLEGKKATNGSIAALVKEAKAA